MELVPQRRCPKSKGGVAVGRGVAVPLQRNQDSGSWPSWGCHDLERVHRAEQGNAKVVLLSHKALVKLGRLDVRPADCRSTGRRTTSCRTCTHHKFKKKLKIAGQPPPQKCLANTPGRPTPPPQIKHINSTVHRLRLRSALRCARRHVGHKDNVARQKVGRMDGRYTDPYLILCRTSLGSPTQTVA